MLKRYISLIVFGLCLLKGSLSFSQERLPVLIPFEGDTLVAITEHQFDVVLFSFSYLRQLERDKELAELLSSRADSIQKFMQEQLKLQDRQLNEKDNVIDNLEIIVDQHQKALRKQKLKATLINIVLGVGLAVETVIIVEAAMR